MSSLKRRLQLLIGRRFYVKLTTRQIFLGILFWALFMLVFFIDVNSDKVSLEEGQVSDRDIVAPRTVAYINEEKTKKLEHEVLASIVDIYDLDVNVLAKADEKVKAVFDLLKNEDNVKNTSPSNIVKAKQTVLNGIKDFHLSVECVELLSNFNGKDYLEIENFSLDFLQRFLQQGVREKELEAVRNQAAAEIDTLQISDEKKIVIKDIVTRAIVPNVFLNAKETEKRKQEAVNSIEPVRETVRKGQVIVRRGEIITRAQINMMENVGLHKGQDNHTKNMGLAILVALTMMIMIAFLYKFEHKIYHDDIMLFLLGAILLFVLCLAKASVHYSMFVAPIAVGGLLSAILISSRVGLIVAVALAILCGIMADYSLRIVLMALLGGIVGVYSVTKKTHGYSLTGAGVLIAIVNVVVIGSSGLMMSTVEGSQIGVQCLMGLINGLASAIITTGILPYLESAFGITTPIKLLELGQSNHPLLQRLLLEAPGTYHHSILIGNLAEAAADVIGADPIIVRVGAYYHDVGKLKRPYFFVENQFGSENPHDKLTPTLSELIVTSHVKDGVDLCNEYKIPKVISDITAQHHGTLLASFFYHKASTAAEHGECVDEDDFRYPGPKPQTKEAALIMIADACEAAVRSISKPNANRIDAMVRKIIRERLNDGQFDECNLTLRNLTEIGDVYVRILSSMFHSRIEYPESVKEIERKSKENGNYIKQFAEQRDSENESRGNSKESHP